MKEKISKFKNIKLYIILLIVASILVIVGLTYAFFAPGGLFGDAAEVTVTTDDVAQLTFTKGSDISLVANLANFSEGAGNITGSTTSRVNFTGTEGSTEKYNVYFNIEFNEYNYSTVDNSPEILLTVIDPDGNPLTELAGYNYVTVGSVSGFDITNKSGLITIKEDYIITGNDTNNEMHEWNVSLTYLNLDVDQGINEGKTLNSKLILQKEKAGIETVCMYQEISNCFVENSNMVETLIQHTPEIATSAGDNNYRYSGGNDIVQNYVCFGSDASVCPKESLYRILGIYNIGGENLVKLIKAYPIDKNDDGVYNVEMEINTKPESYNGSEKNIKKYDFTLEKISTILEGDTFQYDILDNNLWEGANTTEASDDADINIYLNDIYYQNFSSKYQDMIQKNKYYIGKLDSADISSTPKLIYDSIKVEETENNYKIGLINTSDYLYGASEDYWGLSNFMDIDFPYSDQYALNEGQMLNNWMYIFSGVPEDLNSSSFETELTMTPLTDRQSSIHVISAVGSMGSDDVYNGYGIRPVFYLRSSVYLSEGSGTESDPFRLWHAEMPY